MSASPQVRLSELVATLALVSDLGMGRPLERVLRQTVIAMRLADAAGTDDSVRAATYYTSLLTWVGCAADTSELADLFGDEVALYADTYEEDLGGLTMARFVARHLGRGGSPVRRLGLVGRFLVTAGRSVQRVMESHCQAAGDLAVRLDLGEDVREPLLQAFERWDGRGVPGTVGDVRLAPAIRLVHVADCVEAFHHTGGAEAALEVARLRRGTQFDPEVVDWFCDHHDAVLADLGEIRAWDEVISLDPRLGARLTSEQLDVALAALGDFADLKSPYRLGHSRAVATVAAAAGRALGLDEDDVTVLRRAALVQDVGMIGVPSGVWDQASPWSLSQQERARTHPYLTERMLARIPALAPVATVASKHHERLDGSGYPHGSAGDAIGLPARVLAAADVYLALGEERPHRAARSAKESADVLRAEVVAGRLDPDAVQAVLSAAGHPVRRRAILPAGLTRREGEVLALLARGRSNPEIAAQLGISRKTVSSHLEHVYAKVGVSTRTQAALFGMRTGLVGRAEDED